jgi:hypothetical protein
MRLFCRVIPAGRRIAETLMFWLTCGKCLLDKGLGLEI